MSTHNINRKKTAGRRNIFKVESPNFFFNTYPVRSSVSTSLLVFTLLFTFAPYNIYLLPLEWRFAVSLIYGTIPAVIHGIIYHFVRVPLRESRFRWTYGFEMLFYTITFLVSGVIVYSYSWVLVYFFPERFQLSDNFFLLSVFYAFIFGSFVYILIKTFDYMVMLKDKVKEVSQEREEVVEPENVSNAITLSSNTKNGKLLHLALDSILFFEAKGNNLLVFYLNEGVPEKRTIRKTLKEIEEEFPCVIYALYRCHKSFIVNLEHVHVVKGDSKRAMAILTKNYHIPVSRDKAVHLKEMLYEHEDALVENA